MGVCVYTPAFALNAGTTCSVASSWSLQGRYKDEACFTLCVCSLFQLPDLNCGQQCWLRVWCARYTRQWWGLSGSFSCTSVYRFCCKLSTTITSQKTHKHKTKEGTSCLWLSGWTEGRHLDGRLSDPGHVCRAAGRHRGRGAAVRRTVWGLEESPGWRQNRWSRVSLQVTFIYLFFGCRL